MIISSRLHATTQSLARLGLALRGDRDTRTVEGIAPAMPRQRGSAALQRKSNRTRLALLLVAACFNVAPAAAQDAFADAVDAYVPGLNGGFGADLLPAIVLGPPRGGGLVQGSFDVVALGIGGSMVLRFDLPLICDGPGPDFTVFENAFHSGSPTGPLFAEYGFVSVSQDGVNFIDFPYDAVSHVGLAGQTPVLSTSENGIDPLDPQAAGGDTFDLATVSLPWIAFVRITDVAGAIADPGDLPQFTVAPNAGFDLDAVAALHACDPSKQPTSTPTATILPVTATPTATRPPSVPGDLDRDGAVTAADLIQLVAELFDGDGDRASAAGGGTVASGLEADANEDDRITAADLTATTLAFRRGVAEKQRIAFPLEGIASAMPWQRGSAALQKAELEERRMNPCVRGDGG